MYLKDRFHQLILTGFNQPVCLKKNPEYSRIGKPAVISRFAVQERYAKLFPNTAGNTGSSDNSSSGKQNRQKKSVSPLFDAACVRQDVAFSQAVNLFNVSREIWKR